MVISTALFGLSACSTTPTTPATKIATVHAPGTFVEKSLDGHYQAQKFDREGYLVREQSYYLDKTGKRVRDGEWAVYTTPGFDGIGYTYRKGVLTNTYYIHIQGVFTR